MMGASVSAASPAALPVAEPSHIDPPIFDRERAAANAPFRISIVTMTGAAIVIDDAAADDLIWIIKERVFAVDRKLSVHRQRLIYRPGPHGMEPLADNETLGGAGVPQDGSAELDLLLEPMTEKDEALLCYSLLESARCGRANDVLGALEEGANVNHQGAHGGYTPLFVAALGGHLDCVRVLIDAGADLEVGEQGGYTALMIAAGRGHADCVRQLLDVGADQEAKNVLGQTALMLAAGGSHVECLRLLLDAEADKDAADAGGRTALMHAARNGHADCAVVLLDAGADKEVRGTDGSAASDVARQNGHEDLARLIAAHGSMSLTAEGAHKQEATMISEATIGAEDVSTSTFRISIIAMTGAAIVIDDASATDTIRSVKERVHAANRKLPVRRQRLMYRPGPNGIDPLADDETLGSLGVARDGSAELDVLMIELTADEETMLGYKLLDAARDGQAKTVIERLDDGADVDFRSTWTALHLASIYGHADCVRLMLDAGAGTEIADNIGVTALMDAVCGDWFDCARLLMDAGANQEARDWNALTPLLLAARCGRARCARLLLDAGADKEAADCSGNTALMLAASHRHPDCVRLLIETGADKNAKNRHAQTALMLATQSGYADCARLLVDAAADRVT